MILYLRSITETLKPQKHYNEGTFTNVNKSIYYSCLQVTGKREDGPLHRRSTKDVSWRVWGTFKPQCKDWLRGKPGAAWVLFYPGRVSHLFAGLRVNFNKTKHAGGVPNTSSCWTGRPGESHGKSQTEMAGGEGWGC